MARARFSEPSYLLCKCSRFSSFPGPKWKRDYSAGTEAFEKSRSHVEKGVEAIPRSKEHTKHKGVAGSFICRGIADSVLSMAWWHLTAGGPDQAPTLR